MPRDTALDLLDAVLSAKTALDRALVGHAGIKKLQPRDRAFAQRLATTTLRRLGQIDSLIDHCLERKLSRKARPVRLILELGIAQLLFLDIPAHAAVDTTVGLCVKRGHGPHKALVNAVLRRLGREGQALVAEQDAGLLNTPEWLWDAWGEAYGAKTRRRIAEAHLAEPPLDITPKGDAAKWASLLGGEVLPTGSVRLRPKGPVSELAGFSGGEWWVQDAAAAIPARLFAPLKGEMAGKDIIDLCAAPGGKTAQLAAMGAMVTAVDRSAARLQRLGRNMDRLDLKAKIITADAYSWRPESLADGVLLDAPCSATGTIRRHPDVARLKRPKDPAAMAEVQAALLAAAAEMVRPGGTLVYCTCSLQPIECEERIEAFLKSGAPFARQPVMADEVGGLVDIITPAGDLRSLPCHLAERGGMDGFYAARLRRKIL
jgi:16S rRNA (cytosine967-C5)-methyltransferase